MKILQVHNFYQQKGGEDQVCAAEYKLLTDRGNQVSQYFVHNDAIKNISAFEVTCRTIWNNQAYSEITNLIEAEKPDIVHAHNTFPLISPAVYYAASAQGVPVVQTLHNYRLLCPAATLFRNGRVCEECVGASVPYRSVVYGCYRQSRSATAVTAAMLVTHRMAQTWSTKVQAFIALTDFSKAKFVQGGLPPDKILIKPNCLAEDPGIGSGSGAYALFAGRLTEEKGLRTLVTAWERLSPAIPLKIAGEGPLSNWLQTRLRVLPNVQWLGQCDRAEMMSLLGDAAFVVFPSEYYENLPMTIIEAFARGTPVIASRLGSIEEIIQDGYNGFHFSPGDADDLRTRVDAVASNPEQLRPMRQAARLSYERNYTAGGNYILLMNLYNAVILNYKKG